MNQKNGIFADVCREEKWLEFLDYKEKEQQKDCEILRAFIKEKRFLPLCEAWRQGVFPQTLAHKHQISKSGSTKKRVVYSYEGDEGIFLKFIAFQMYRYEEQLCDNCYAFRRELGVRHAVKRLLPVSARGKKYCLKTDISNYFNSIRVDLLLEKLEFLKETDASVYQLFERMLREERVMDRGNIRRELKGAMAGVPVSAFFANIYLKETDAYFQEKGTLYLRYSDDILIFADSGEELYRLRQELYSHLKMLGLQVNPEKEHITEPGEPFEFLGLCFDSGKVDLSMHRIEKTRGKIRRKARALRRWQQKKGLSPDKAAIGLIRAMNRKFYGKEEDDFTWSRWYFPLLNVDQGLHQIDLVMQEYIRYAVTGRHFKGNYRITYEQMKGWGYRSLVHEFWKFKNEKEEESNEQRDSTGTVG